MEVWWWEAAALGIRFCSASLRKVALGTLACTFALGGAVIGSITGAVKGQTTETGLLHGAAIGAVAGAVVSIEVLESCLQGDLLSKIAIFHSLLNGKVFREWVCPAMLKAYQWQISMPESNDTGTTYIFDISRRMSESSYIETTDIFDISRNRGLLPEIIKKLPKFEIICSKNVNLHGETASCSICLQDFKEGESARRLPGCGHFFHSPCIDKWLAGHDSCPICRQVVLNI